VEQIKFIFNPISFLLVSTILGCSQVNNNPTDCSEFKTGEFTFSEKSDVRIIRKDGIQKEYSTANSGFIDEYQIEWTSPCSYKLWLVKTNQSKGLDFSDTDTLFVEITSTAPKGYTYKAAKNGEIFEGQMLVVKD